MAFAAPIKLQASLDNSTQHTGAPPHYSLSIEGNIKASGRITSDEYVQITGVAIEGSECSTSGLIGQDGGGRLLTCQMGLWLFQKTSTIVKEHSNIGFRFPSATVLCGPYQRVISGGGSCEQTGGFTWMVGSRPYGNGWKVECDGGQLNEWGTAHVWAICAT
ncbi:hypothetical protein BGZ46_005850 [Entomortierella lignicola]|nr:hypothetical protein BGZ46_005850 [Entomortierella lignicola]